MYVYDTYRLLLIDSVAEHCHWLIRAGSPQAVAIHNSEFLVRYTATSSYCFQHLTGHANCISRFVHPKKGTQKLYKQVCVCVCVRYPQSTVKLTNHYSRYSRQAFYRVPVCLLVILVSPNFLFLHLDYFFFIVSISNITPQKINMEPENHRFGKENRFQTLHV